MSDSTQRADGFPWWGVLLIVSMVGLNTAFMVREQTGTPLTALIVETWLTQYGIHFGLGLFVIGVIVYQLRR